MRRSATRGGDDAFALEEAKNAPSGEVQDLSDVGLTEWKSNAAISNDVSRGDAPTKRRADTSLVPTFSRELSPLTFCAAPIAAAA
jgi:hypothetical protein